MQEVGVDREGGLAALVLGDGDLVLLGELEEFGAGGEVPLAPGGDDADLRVEGVGGELEADLVVALAGGAVGDGVGAGRCGDLDEALGDERAGDGGAEEVEALVLGVGAEHREDEVAHEGLAQVLDEDVLGRDAEELGLLARGLQLLALAEVGGEGDDLAAVLGRQPLQDDRGVEAAGIGEDDLLRGRHAGLRRFAIGGFGLALSGFRGRDKRLPARPPPASPCPALPGERRPRGARKGLPLGRRLAVGRLCGLPPAEAAASGRSSQISPRLLAGPLVCSIGFHASMKAWKRAGASAFRQARRAERETVQPAQVVKRAAGGTVPHAGGRRGASAGRRRRAAGEARVRRGRRSPPR